MSNILTARIEQLQAQLEAARCTINEQARTIADFRTAQAALVAAVAAPGAVLAAAPVAEAVYPPMIVKEVAP